jgi:methionyl-tRNA formyltransferase
MRCWQAAPDSRPHSGAQPGEVIDAGDDGIIVQTGSGLIRLLELQMPGRQKIRAAEFANGYESIGKILGR